MVSRKAHPPPTKGRSDDAMDIDNGPSQIDVTDAQSESRITAQLALIAQHLDANFDQLLNTTISSAASTEDSVSGNRFHEALDVVAQGFEQVSTDRIVAPKLLQMMSRIAQVSAELHTIDGTQDGTARPAADQRPVKFDQTIFPPHLWWDVARVSSRLLEPLVLARSLLSFHSFVDVAGAFADIAHKSQTSFRDYYMAQMTEIFGDELDQLRQKEDISKQRLALLIDNLEAGLLVFDENDVLLTTDE
ncbi:hypothetical protein H4R33_000853 [Dimargaris cristalligena]|uniref:Ribosome assembly protein 3 n=1 Tax=Dimargaris cristalligena TaxID=215637 RepID=A0A4V1J5H9_9FUNG|nr:hypothetical protein H4R33_000853 [Dimargaris cristalligena]RKP39119.1 hypothetical protein BJ085DRAFT_29509 [Dimargaris cristalligena]|eukprot:RKP39119.1 hypothetical protein BJ085DRAFT_29509 [Dimargaris cristalligena]